MKVGVGVDIGSLTAKSVVIDRDHNIISYKVIQGTIVDEQAAISSLEQALAKGHLSREQVGFLVTTGYGRNMVGFGDKNITEISCHARGAQFLVPGAKTVIDIGGQDSKVIALNGRGSVVNFSMNDKCAAGTGRFLEVMANALDVKLKRWEAFH